MLEKVENYIRQWKMLEKGDKVVVGLSGGADSVCLFLILEELRKKIGFEILAVHVNHGIRGEEAKADEEFVKTLCEKKEIPCRSVSVDIPKMAVEIPALPARLYGSCSECRRKCGRDSRLSETYRTG